MNSASPIHALNCGVISPAPSSLAFYFNTIFLKIIFDILSGVAWTALRIITSPVMTFTF